MFRVLHMIVVLATLSFTGLVHAAGAEGPADVMAGSWVQAVTAIVAFTLLLAILAKFAWGPMLQGLQDRENKIKADLEAAETAAAEAKTTLESYKQQLKDAQVEARVIIDAAVKDAQAAQKRGVAETQDEIKKAHERARTDIDLAKDKALQELYAQTAALATVVAEKLLQREIDGTDTQQLVDQSLKELEQLN